MGTVLLFFFFFFLLLLLLRLFLSLFLLRVDVLVSGVVVVLGVSTFKR